MSDGTPQLENGAPKEAPKSPKPIEAPKSAVGEKEKNTAGTISEGINLGEDPDKILRNLATTAEKSDKSTAEAKVSSTSEAVPLTPPQPETDNTETAPQENKGTFRPSTQWQEVPKGVGMPMEAQMRMDTVTGKVYMRWDNPPDREITYNLPPEASKPTVPTPEAQTTASVPEAVPQPPEHKALDTRAGELLDKQQRGETLTPDEKAQWERFTGNSSQASNQDTQPTANNETITQKAKQEEKQQIDLDYRKRRVDVIKRAKDQLASNKEGHLSLDTINSNEIVLNSIHERLASLDDSKNLEKARLMVTDYAEMLSFLGNQVRIKAEIDSKSHAELIDDDLSILEEFYAFASPSEKVFMSACEKLFPDIKVEVGTRDLKGNFEAAATQYDNLDHNTVPYHRKYLLKIGAEQIGEPGISDQYETRIIISQLGEDMHQVIYEQDDPSSSTLKPIPENTRDSMIAAAKAMYIVKLSTPYAGLSPIEMELAKRRADLGNNGSNS